MAMSDTGSSFAQWAGMYHHDPLPALPTDDDLAAGAAAAAAGSPTSGGSSGSPTTTAKAAAAGQHQHQQLLLHGVEGPRAGKPARRRSRASRRAPVTLLNTDAANFRAMVQQFTGIPAPPAGAFGGPVINFAADYGFPPPHSSASAAVMAFDFDHHHQHQLHAATPLQDQQQLRRQQYTGASSASPFGYGGGGGGGLLQGGGGDVFGSHGLASAEDRLLLQSIQAASQMPHMTPASAAGANTTTTSGFFA
ncbi:hypothetical protein U9M48_026670 [Paspalum notatum var. saurae]|uniref:VQ domain-containing protein n=1 Tax=Paspalum notatum var. saurae TaxID=547442 RepID=A0AAQ3TVR1_PASNO